MAERGHNRRHHVYWQRLSAREECIVALANGDPALTIEQIAEATASSPRTVTTALWRARRFGHEVAARPHGRPCGFTLRLPIGLRAALEPFAATRGLSVDALIQRLLAEAARSDLIDAILDDEGDDDDQ